MTPALPSPAWLVGCGNMAGAMVAGWRAAGVDFSGATVIRPSGRPVEGVKTVTDYPAGEQPRFVMLGFKPQKLDEIAPSLAPAIGPDTCLVSMLAGVSASSLRARFPGAGGIVRVMPNIPVAQRQGVIGLYAADTPPDGTETVSQLMGLLGFAAWCRTEAELGALGAVAAAGVAYVARFAEALARAGEKFGLEAGLAARVVNRTLVGTGVNAEATGASMAEIVRRVASPNGTTERGLAVLDAPDGLVPLVSRAIEAAVRRGEELAAEAGGRD